MQNLLQVRPKISTLATQTVTHEVRQMPNVLNISLQTWRHNSKCVIKWRFVLRITVMGITENKQYYCWDILELCFWAKGVFFWFCWSCDNSWLPHSTQTSSLTLVGVNWWHLIVVFWQDELLEGKIQDTDWMTIAFSCFTGQYCIDKVSVDMFMELNKSC